MTGDLEKRLADLLDVPQDQALPCLIAFVCTRYHGKSFVRKLAETERFSLWASLKIAVALIRWSWAYKRDHWGEYYRITKFSRAWRKATESEEPHE